MRFGETYNESYERKKKLSEWSYVGEWKTKFAWLPVRINGQNVWWEHYRVRDRWFPVKEVMSHLWPGFWRVDKEVID